VIRVGILTISDLGSQGKRKDTAGLRLRERIEAAGWTVDCYEIIPDEKEIISARLREWVDTVAVHLVLTTGGTGFAERDVTPEATLEVLEKETPGISEAIRAAGLQKTPNAMLSRGVSGLRRQTLIVNLPGSEKGAIESLDAIMRALPHAVDVILGKPGH